MFEQYLSLFAHPQKWVELLGNSVVGFLSGNFKGEKYLIIRGIYFETIISLNMFLNKTTDDLPY